MKHLFIINPRARRLIGRIEEVVGDIRSFFGNYPHIQYDIHVTRWKRDAEGYTRRYVSNAAEIVRVYAVGGTGTLFEVISGVAGLPNVQVTMYPFGRENSFLHYFGTENIDQFLSLRNLVFSRSASFDIIRFDHKYGMNFCIIGVEAMAAKLGNFIIDHLGFLSQNNVLSTGIYLFTALYYSMLPKSIRYYRIDVDGNSFAGNYTGLVIANQPFFGKNMYPAADARPDDGIMDLYVTKPGRFRNALKLGSDYIHGHYERWPDILSHYRGKRISVTSDQVMPVCLDGEIFFDAAVHAELIPHALEFTGPASIEIFGKGRSHE